MKFLICQTLLIVAVVTCDVICDDDPEVDVNSPEYSRRLQDDYKTYTVSEPSVLKTPRLSSAPLVKNLKIVRTSPTPKAIKASPPPPFVRRIIEDIGPVAYKTNTYTVPKRVVQTYSPPSIRIASQDDDSVTRTDDNTSVELDSNDYQPDDDSGTPPSSQPITVYNVYPVIRRERFRPRSYRRYNPYRGIQPLYRTIRYGDRSTYTIRRIPSRYSPPIDDYRYPRPVETLRYAPLVNLVDDDIDYDEYAKKK